MSVIVHVYVIACAYMCVQTPEIEKHVSGCKRCDAQIKHEHAKIMIPRANTSKCP